MCTIAIAKNVFPGKPIVVAANRDELLDRPSETPKFREDPPIKVLAPKDLVRGGFWVGVNASGVIAGLTNRLNVTSIKGRVSRGKLISDSLQCRSASEAHDLIKNLSGSSFNGFYMIVADKNQLFYLDGDGKEIKSQIQPDGLFIISNHGIGWPSFRSVEDGIPKRVSNVLEVWNNLKPLEPHPECLKKLLDIHDAKRYGSCINEPLNNYGTKSSSIIHLNDYLRQWDYWHRERQGNHHICLDPFIQQLSLQIQ